MLLNAFLENEMWDQVVFFLVCLTVPGFFLFDIMKLKNWRKDDEEKSVIIKIGLRLMSGFIISFVIVTIFYFFINMIVDVQPQLLLMAIITSGYFLIVFSYWMILKRTFKIKLEM